MPGSDFFMVIGVYSAGVDVSSAPQVFVAQADTEEEAVAKVAAVLNNPEEPIETPKPVLYTAQVVPTFPPPQGPQPKEVE